MQKNVYLNSWTQQENEFISERGEFAIAISIGNDDCIDGYLFEYDPMLTYILDLNQEKIDYGSGETSHQLIRFFIKSQFLLLRVNICQETVIIGHYDTREDAEIEFKNKTVDLALQIATDNNEEYTRYTIIDLSTLTPFFFKIGALRKPTHYELPLVYLK